MAVSKIHALYNTLGKAISYITNPDKTDSGRLVSSFGCSIETAAIEMKLTADQGRKLGNRIGYHMLQSFSPEDDITPEKAHELGKEFADRMLKGKFEYVIATHIDKEHIHNHIIINATSFYDYNKYHHDKGDTQRMHDINDEICRENNLSVIEKKPFDREKKKYRDGKDGNLKSKLCAAIDDAVSKSKTFEEFLEIMKLEGYEHAYRGQMLRFKVPSPSGYKMIRAKDTTLGEKYTEEAIRERIRNPQQQSPDEKTENCQQQPNGDLMDERQPSYIEPENKIPQDTAKQREKEPLYETGKNKGTGKPAYKPDRKRINLIVDISKNIKAQESNAYGQALVRNNINTLVKTMNFLIDNKIQDPEDFKNYYAAKNAEYKFIKKDVKQMGNRLAALSDKIKFAQDYKKYHNLYHVAMRAGNRTKFYMEHEKEILAFETAQLYFTQSGENPDKINLADLFAEYRRIKEDKFVTGLSLKEAGKEMKELDTVCKNVEAALGIELVEKKTRNQTKEDITMGRKKDMER